MSILRYLISIFAIQPQQQPFGAPYQVYPQPPAYGFQGPTSPSSPYPQQYPTTGIAVAPISKVCGRCSSPLDVHHCDYYVRCCNCGEINIIDVDTYYCRRRRFQRVLGSGIVLFIIGIICLITTGVLFFESDTWFIIWGITPTLLGIIMMIRGTAGLRAHPLPGHHCHH